MLPVVHGRERAVGVLREVLVARRVEQVEDAAAVLEGHHRGDDRDAALALDVHPVRAGLGAVVLGLDLAGELDGAAEQQQLLGQRRLAGVRVGDDGEGAPPRDGVGGAAVDERALHGAPRHLRRPSGREEASSAPAAPGNRVGAFFPAIGGRVNGAH